LATGSAEANQLVPCGDDVIDYRLQLLDFMTGLDTFSKSNLYI